MSMDNFISGTGSATEEDMEHYWKEVARITASARQNICAICGNKNIKTRGIIIRTKYCPNCGSTF